MFVSSKVARATAIAFLLYSTSLAVEAQASSNSVWIDVAKDCDNQDPKLLLALALQESKRLFVDGYVAPHPYAIHLDGKGYFPKSIEEAEKILSELPECANVDIGLLQINWYWHCDNINDPINLLDPYFNLKFGSHLLCKAMASAPNDKILGIGRYHHWADETKSRKYGKSVFEIYQRLKPYDLGQVNRNAHTNPF